jgi:peroxiredoxin
MSAVAAGLALASSGCAKPAGAGRLAPDFSLNDLGGKSVSLASQRGNVVLLTFWAVG